MFKQLSLKDYENFDKTEFVNCEYLQERLDNFDLQDYRSWFKDYDYSYIKSVINN
jgi:hypothetical protein